MALGLYDPKRWDEATRGLDVELTRALRACIVELASALPQEPSREDLVAQKGKLDELNVLLERAREVSSQPVFFPAHRTLANRALWVLRLAAHFSLGEKSPTETQWIHELAQLLARWPEGIDRSTLRPAPDAAENLVIQTLLRNVRGLIGQGDADTIQQEILRVCEATPGLCRGVQRAWDRYGESFPSYLDVILSTTHSR